MVCQLLFKAPVQILQIGLTQTMTFFQSIALQIRFQLNVIARSITLENKYATHIFNKKQMLRSATCWFQIWQHFWFLFRPYRFEKEKKKMRKQKTILFQLENWKKKIIITIRKETDHLCGMVRERQTWQSMDWWCWQSSCPKTDPTARIYVNKGRVTTTHANNTIHTPQLTPISECRAHSLTTRHTQTKK